MAVVETRRFSVPGVASCAVFAISALAFVRWWIALGVYPVLRGTTMLTPVTGFLEFWTRVFLVAALAGIVLGALGLRRGPRPRTTALVGLVLNLGSFIAVTVLTSTGTFPPDFG